MALALVSGRVYLEYKLLVRLCRDSSTGLTLILLHLQLHAAAQSYTAKVKGKEGITSQDTATLHDESDLYLVNPDGEFIASYGPNAEPKAMGKEFSDTMKVSRLLNTVESLL